MLTALRRAAMLAGVVALAGLLSACVLSSATNLVDDAEGAMPLPASFSMYGYKDDNGGYASPDVAPGTFVAQGNAYVGGSDRDGDAPMTVRFVPLDGDSYLIQITSRDPGALYGIARLRQDGIMALRMIFGDGIEAALDAARATAPADIADDLVYEDGGITVSRRATLDYVVGLIRSGALPTEPLVAWIAGDASATPPARIVPDGDWYKIAD